MALPLVPIISGVGGIVSGLFGHSAEKEKARKEAEMRGSEMRASPWTKMAPTTQVSQPGSLAGSLIGGLGGGLSLGQNISGAFDQRSPWEKMFGSEATPEDQAMAKQAMARKMVPTMGGY